MVRGVKIRLIAFVVLSSVGIVYVAATYLGLVDRILGRGLTIHATLPESGGLFEGSEVTYRGVKIGRVDEMHVTADGTKLDLALEEGTKLPLDSVMYVHNLSAVGEQYLDFEPAGSDGPYAKDGHTFAGDESALPVAEDDLLVDLDDLVNSVDTENLGIVVSELGNLFRDTGHSMQRLLDGGTEFIDQASAHTDETIALLRSAKSVLKTQSENGENIKAFSRNLNLLTNALAGSDKNLRAVLQGTPGAVREVDSLLKELKPTLPILFANLVTTNQVVVAHLAGVETLLVSFPLAIAAGFSGTPGDGFGHVNLQLDQTVGPCSGAGYKPVEDWRPGNDLSDGEIYPAECLKNAPFNQRGSKYSPTAGNSPAGLQRGVYDPATGETNLVVNRNGDPIRLHPPQDLSRLGDEAWTWLLVGPLGEKGSR